MAVQLCGIYGTVLKECETKKEALAEADRLKLKQFAVWENGECLFSKEK